MKTIHPHILFLLVLLVLSPALPAQIPTSNYVRTRTMLDDTDFMETIKYVDGLGRPTQTNHKGQSGDGSKDIVTLTQYDELGRPWKEWIPTAIAGNGDEVTNLSDFTNSQDTHPFSLKIYGYGQMNRLVEEYGAGQSWHNAGKKTRMVYGFNSTTVDNRRCRHYKLNTNGDLVLDGYYQDMVLEVIETYDEDNKIHVQYKNDKGQTVLTRQKSGIVWFDTYYVYDVFGLLRYVLPPAFSEAKSVSADLINKYAYVYTYDSSKRCIRRQFPGPVVISYVYDKANRLRLCQDAVQAENGNWTYYKYDALGRMILTGILSDNASRATMEERVLDDSRPLHETYTGAGTNDRYSTNSYPVEADNPTTLVAYYYDDYDFSYGLLFHHKDYVTGVSDPELSSVRGLLTGTKIAMLDQPGTFVGIITRYGEDGRPVQVISNNARGGVDKEFYRYNRQGQVVEKQMEHHLFIPYSTISEHYRYEYDHAGRLEKTFYDYNSGTTPKLMSELFYDDLGRLAQKKLYKQSGTQVLETINYAYNIRSWPTEISSESYQENLYYTPQNGMSGLYNGNISVQTVNYPNEGTLVSGYKYTYDGLNRMTKAVYGEGTQLSTNANRYSETFSYDRNGNVTRHANQGLKQANTYAALQDLTLTYDGNRLKKAQNGVATSTAYGHQFFVDGANTAVEYVYDANGNMTQDHNKGIAFVKYNYLNLPEIVQMTNGNSIRYSYDALGRKHKQETITLKAAVDAPLGAVYPVTPDQIQTNRKVYYCGNVIYAGINTIARLMTLTDEGFLSHENYHNFQIKDHLGNVRAEVDDFGTQYAVNYYPSGIKRLNTGLGSNYAFANKEHQNSHGLNWYDFGKRFYDPSLTLWPTLDPLCENHYSISPYAYCGGDPVNRFDPDGRDWHYNMFTNHYVWKEGSSGIDGYVNIGALHTEDLGDGSYIAYYQNVGIKVNQNVSIMDILNESLLMQNMLLGKESPLSEKSKSALFNTITRNEMNDLGQEIGQALYTVMEFTGVSKGLNWIGKGVAKLFSRAAGKLVEKGGEYIVYFGSDASGVTRYVGITRREAAIRFAEHAASKTSKSTLQYKIVDGATGLTRTQARTLEQTLINQHGLGKNGGTLFNKINSIAPKYWEQYGITP